MKKNVGKKEGIVRVMIGLVLLALPPMFQFPIWATALTYGIALIALITGVIGYCPAWKLLGISTCHRH